MAALVKIFYRGATKWLVSLFLCGCFSNLIQAQEQDSLQKTKEVKVLGISVDSLLTNNRPNFDTRYIASYRDKLHVDLLTEFRDYTLRIAGNGRNLKYQPNQASALGVGISYRWASFDFTFKVPVIAANEEKKGITDQFGLGLNFSGRKVWFNAIYQMYGGLYLRNPEVIDPNWFQTHASYPLRGDMKSKTLFTRLFYNFNHRRYSNPASQWQQEGQVKSAGSFLAGVSYNYAQIQADSSLVPARVQAQFPPDADIVRYRSASYSLNVGYVYTWVFAKYFFANLSVRPGIALKNINQVSVGQSEQKVPAKLGLQGDSRLAVGFNDDRYYGGVSVAGLLLSGRLENETIIRNTYTVLRFEVGRRFDFHPRGVLRKVPGFE